MLTPRSDITNIERVTRRKTALINNGTANNKNNNTSTGRQNPKPNGTTETPERILTRNRTAHIDSNEDPTTREATTITTNSVTAITTTDVNVDTSFLSTTSASKSAPSCPSTPAPVETLVSIEQQSNSTTATEEQSMRQKSQEDTNITRNKVTNKYRKSSKRPPTSISNNQPDKIPPSATSNVNIATLSKPKQEANGVTQTENTEHVPVAKPQPISTSLLPAANSTTTDKAKNDVVPEADADTPPAPAAATTKDITNADISSSKDDPQDTKDAMEALVRIEVEFARFRQKLFDEKMELLHQEMLLIEKGLHPDQMKMMNEIEKKRNTSIEIATAKRDMNRLAHQMRYESTVYQAELAFTRKRKDLRTNIHQSLSKQRLKLNDEHMNITRELPDLQDVSPTQRRRRFNQIYELQSKMTTGFPRAPPAQGACEQTTHSDLTAIQGKLASEQASTLNSHYDQSSQSPPIFSTTPTTSSSASSSSTSSFPSTMTAPVIMGPSYYHPIMHHYRYTFKDNDMHFHSQQLQHGHKMNGIPMVDIRQDPTIL